MVADNDYALGMLVEAVSKSRFWASTAIFVLEDDAQNGPDHVDSHRSPAFLISPYVRHHAVDSSMYNTASMLRTMELILGLRPMTQFDAAARPMSAAFQSDCGPGALQGRKAARAARRTQSLHSRDRRAILPPGFQRGRSRRCRRVERYPVAGHQRRSCAAARQQFLRTLMPASPQRCMGRLQLPALDAPRLPGRRMPATLIRHE